MNFQLECEREDDGRWLAEVPQLPGVLAYGATAAEAMAKAEILALRASGRRPRHATYLRRWPAWVGGSSGRRVPTRRSHAKAGPT